MWCWLQGERSSQVGLAKCWHCPPLGDQRSGLPKGEFLYILGLWLTQKSMDKLSSFGGSTYRLSSRWMFVMMMIGHHCPLWIGFLTCKPSCCRWRWSRWRGSVWSTAQSANYHIKVFSAIEILKYLDADILRGKVGDSEWDANVTPPIKTSP